ncbi:30S ribosome-binding factor RbfA [Solimonas terrae]|uniref:Ribosome-binding factor A n=1 Tax=Solimonas terrae TaxID=1396819 RepID=A0A6M2BU67_9GAMM|nr:30S ribosome-binding factor RbfA [Solimonas terrae]NGY06146.1 30S ribosome-binding factor RbfA [Solimonas terrae]
MREYPRTLRINTQLQGELSTLIRGELSDPRVLGVTITKVDVSPDLRNARISVSLLGSDEQLKDALKGLNHAAGKLRYELGERLRLRHVPQLHFAADTALREGDRISALIRAAVRSDDNGEGDSPGHRDESSET